MSETNNTIDLSSIDFSKLSQEQIKAFKNKLAADDTTPHTLPDGKILIQKFAKILDDGIYSKAIEDISGEMQFVEAGMGVDVISGNAPQMQAFNALDRGGSDYSLMPNAIQRANLSSNVDTLKLKPAGTNSSNNFKQIWFTKQQILFIQNFLASNPEKFEEAILQAQPTLIRYRYILLAQELKRLITKTQAKAPSDLTDASGNLVQSIPLTNNIRYSANGSANFVSAIAAVNYVMSTMQNDNETFAIGADGTNGRPIVDGILTNCENLDNLSIYMAPWQKFDLVAKLRNAAVRESNLGNENNASKIKNIVERIKALPLQVKNPLRDIIKVLWNDGTIAYFQISLIEDGNANSRNWQFTELSSIKPITIASTPKYTNVKFGIFKENGEDITADGLTGTFVYDIGSVYDTAIIPVDTALIVYKNGETKEQETIKENGESVKSLVNDNAGISTLFNINITNTQEWLKALAKDHYTTIGMNVVSANTTRLALYTDAGFSKVASIDTSTN